VKDGIPELATLWAAQDDPIRLVALEPTPSPAMPKAQPQAWIAV
jgi:hypothetical protein